MSEFPSRVSAIEPSATVRIGDLAAKRRAKGHDVIDLSVGDPDFVTPSHIRSAAKAALDNGETHYTSSAGLPELRKEIVKKLKEQNDIQAAASNVIVTPGAKHGLFEVLFSLLSEDDEVVLLDPSWVSYEAITRMCGGEVRRITLDSNTGFSLGDTDLSEAITNRTQVIILNTPSNPTGAVLSESDLRRIRDLAIDHDVWVIADEIYERISYDVTPVSIASFEGMAERTITVNGFSKSYAMTGWRVGYYVAPDRLIEQTSKVQSHTVTCATSFAQHGAIEALKGPEQPVTEMRQSFKNRRDAAVRKLRSEGVNITCPDGAFYLFLPVDSTDDVALCKELLNKNVAVTPGSAFGVDGYIRLSYANDQQRVLEGIDRISEHLQTN